MSVNQSQFVELQNGNILVSHGISYIHFITAPSQKDEKGFLIGSVYGGKDP